MAGVRTALDGRLHSFWPSSPRPSDRDHRVGAAARQLPFNGSFSLRDGAFFRNRRLTMQPEPECRTKSRGCIVDLRHRKSASLCMIVRDEEQNLGDCLTPVAHLFDEVVIVDTGSRDRTRQIARQFTPCVFDFPWCDDFSAARNESMRRARGEWIMWLDADDRLRPENVEKLRALLDILHDQPRAFLMDTMSIPAAGEEPSVVTHPRLFRRHPAVEWRGRVHEQLSPDLQILGYECAFSDVQIDHWGYVDPATSARKLRRKLRLLRMDYAVDPDRPSTLLHLGLTQLGMGNIEQARRHLLRLASSKLPSASFARCVYCVLTNVALHEGQLAEALQFAERGLALAPNDEQFLYAKAYACFGLSDYATASRALTAIIQAPPGRQMHFGNVGNVKQKLAPHMLGAIQYMQREYPQAEATIRSLLAEFPDHASSWYNLGLVYVATRQARKLEWVINRLGNCPGGRLDANLLRARWHLRQGELAAAGALIDQIISEAPQAACPRMLRVEWLSRQRAPLDAQLQAVRDVLRIEPGNLEAQGWIAKLEQARSPIAPAPAETWSSYVVSAPGVVVG
jgi:glycosyltransferase involved in cell wall biosynthesis